MDELAAEGATPATSPGMSWGRASKSICSTRTSTSILDVGKTYQVPLPVTGAVRELYTTMLAAGRGGLDHSAVVTVLEDLAHVQVQKREEEGESTQ